MSEVRKTGAGSAPLNAPVQADAGQEQARTAAKAAGKAALKSVEAGSEVVVETVQSTERAADAMLGGLDMAVPAVVRALAEKAVAQSREAYDQARTSMEEAIETLEKSLDRAGQGAAAINRKVIDIAQTNVNSSFDFARNLAAARNLGEIVELQAAFARKQLDTLMAQVEEMRALSAKVATESGEPLKAHFTRTLDTLKRAS